ncbi:MAG: NAD(+) synthase [Chloroflexota bacterium]|nr:MAG: NAD(+) synthase [Chloroflexota bacterium]
MNDDPLRIDARVTQQVLVGFLKNEITKAGFQRAVLSVTGDLDTTLACYLAVNAIGPESVDAIHMPASNSRAMPPAGIELLEQELGIVCQVVDVKPLVDLVLSDSADSSTARLGDVIARVRMTVLYDRATVTSALVIGASNKSDLLLGLGTVHGDLASAVNPLGDLYRTQARRLVAELGLPEKLLRISGDSDQLGAHLGSAVSQNTYGQVDPLLYLLFDERYSAEEAAGAGFDDELISEALSRFRGSHAQRALPLIPKLSGRTVGHDLRYLRDSHT